MFWRKKKTTPHKTKKLTQKEIMSHIEQLSSGESVEYRLPAVYSGQVAVVEFNTEHPWRGRKYELSLQTSVDSKLKGEKELVLESDEVKDVATWLSKQKVKLLNLTGN
jgi:hypothetical protein